MRMSISLSEKDYEVLQGLAEQQKLSLSEVIRKAIATESYLYNERVKGSKLLLMTQEKEMREVVFR